MSDDIRRYKTKEEALASDAKDNDYVSLNLDDGSYVVYKANLYVQDSSIKSSYFIGTMGDLRSEKSPLILVSSKRSLIFSFDPTSESYRVSPDPSVPESLRVDTSFFPMASVGRKLESTWIMTMMTSRFERMVSSGSEGVDSARKICKGSKFLALDGDLYSPSAQKLTEFVHSFSFESIGNDPYLVGDELETESPKIFRNSILIVSIVACEAGKVPLSPEEMRRIDIAVERVNKLGLGDAPEVLSDDGDFFQ